MRAKRSLGQNFLRDERVIRDIMESVHLQSDDVVLEVGPGEGVLTERLAQSGATIIAVELDDRLIPVLEKKFEKFPNVHIIHANILRVHIEELLARYGLQVTRYKVVGNLPYYITSAIIRMFLEGENSPQEMYCMVQKEVARRICAKPGEMSILAVAVQYYANSEILFDVPATAFDPVPKVDSSFIRITPKFQPENYNPQTNKQFFRIVKIGFSAKRKTLVNNLSNGLHREREDIVKILESLRISIRARAQDLDIGQWKELLKEVSVI